MTQVDADSCLPGDSSQKFRAGWYHFTMLLPIYKPRIEAPKVVNLRNEPGPDLATLHTMRGKAHGNTLRWPPVLQRN